MATQLPQIPFIYTFFFLWLEPIFAFNGAILCHIRPQTFLTTFTPTALYTPSSQVIYDQLAATYVLFAFNEAVVLRITKDLRVWKTILAGIIVCDALHLYASWCELGSEVYFNPQLWRMEEWLNYGLLYGPLVLRSAFLAEVGFGRKEIGTKRS